MKSPAFLLYHKDLLTATAHWSAQELGWYIRLLCHQAQHGDLPNDPEILASIAGVRHTLYDTFKTSLSETLSDMFSELPGTEENQSYPDSVSARIHNPQLTKILEEQALKSTKKSILAVLGNFIRHQKLNEKQAKELKKGFKTTDFTHLAGKERAALIREYLTEKLKSLSTSSIKSEELFEPKTQPVTNKEKVIAKNIDIFLSNANSRRQQEHVCRTYKITTETYKQFLDHIIATYENKFYPTPLNNSYINQALPNYLKKLKENGNASHTASTDSSNIIGSEFYDYEISG